MISAALVNVIKVALLNPSAFADSGKLLDLLRPVPIVMAAVLFFAMKKIKLHPIVFLGVSAVIGILLKL